MHEVSVANIANYFLASMKLEYLFILLFKYSSGSFGTYVDKMNNCCKGGTDDGILNGPVVNYRKLFKLTIPEIFSQKLRKNEFNLHKIAVQYGDFQTLTFEQVEVFSSAIAKTLSDKIGFTTKCKNPDSDLLIAICISPSEKFVTLLFAILKTGAGYIPLDPDYPEELLLLILQAFRPLLLVADDNGPIFNKFDPQKFLDICAVLSVEELWLDMELPSKLTIKSNRRFTHPTHEDMVLNVEVNKDSSRETPAVVIQTIGPLKEPRGVRISHRNIMNHITWEWASLGLKSKDVCTMTFPISSIENTVQIFASMLTGCTLNIFKRTDLYNMTYFTDLLSARNVTRVGLYNYQLHHFLTAIDNLGREETQRRLGDMKSVICRGEILTRPDVKWFFKVFKDGVILGNAIGPTEATGALVYEKFHSAKEFDSKLMLEHLSLSRVFDNCRIYTLGSQNEIISDGNQGEICCSGYNVALGYVNEEASIEGNRPLFQANPQRFRRNQFNRIFHTGEYGRICSKKEEHANKRHLYIEGRCDRFIKHKGHTLSVDNIKNYLSTLPCVEECFVLIYHQGKFDQELIASFAMRSPLQSEILPDSAALEEMARAMLPEFAVPEEFKIINEIPKTPTGKPFPTQLLLQYEQTREPNFAIMERGILREDEDLFTAKKYLFSAMFKFASIPLEMSMANTELSLFEIGVTSLNALSILLYLQRNGYPISLMEFLRCPTLADVTKELVVKQQQRGLGHGHDRDRLAYFVVELKDNYAIDALTRSHKRNAVELLAQCYAEKGYLQKYNLVTYNQYLKFFSDNWNTYQDSQISFAVRRKCDHKIVAVALNVDFFQVIDTSKAEGALFHMVEFIHEIKGSCIDEIPKRKFECFENQWMGTDSSLSASDNIMIITQMQTEILKLAKMAHSCIFTVCFSPITKRLCQDIFGYKTLDIFPVNEYTELDRSKPFKLASDTTTVAACFFHIKTPEPISSLSSMTTDLSPEELMNYV